MRATVSPRTCQQVSVLRISKARRLRPAFGTADYGKSTRVREKQRRPCPPFMRRRPTITQPRNGSGF
ncbi:hypothetical protein KP509_04G096300 [Ceratopteris richardii]|uniref:Uncharacterized protein n=1 Tax=Ceratopteris richardii TaxID=49495 RepID=A0A8T2V354_CERRI|nr:hypothetical protein KP509_04G096300 [Ceratopteris richardii]